jgi:hypothetical protein
MKAWYKSKTLWVNLVAAVLMALEAGTGLLKPYMADTFWVIMAVGLPIVNAVLRIITTQALGKVDA